jgi:outer membrane lipoprotein-sorting protein
MRFYLLILLCGSFIYTAQAQEVKEQSDPDALALLKAVKKNYLSDSAKKIDFTLDMEFPGQAKESQPGVLIQSGEKFVLEMQGRKIISDTEQVWMYIEELNEVQINDADFETSEDFMSPSDIFKLDESDQLIFAITQYGKEDGQDVTYVECKPTDSFADYAKMRLAVISKSNQVHHLKIFMKDGSRHTLTFSQVVPYDTNENTFKFDATQYEGVHIEDLRF